LDWLNEALGGDDFVSIQNLWKREFMPRKKSVPLSFGMKIIVALGGIGSVIAIILAVIPIMQTERDKIEQNSFSATAQALQFQQLEIIRQIGTVDALKNANEPVYATQTALVQELNALRAVATQNAVLYPLSTSTVTAAEQPLDIIFALDISNSMYLDKQLSSTGIQKGIDSAVQIMEAISIQRPDSKFGVVVFGESASLLDHSNDKEKIRRVLENVLGRSPEGHTSTFEGMLVSYLALTEQDSISYLKNVVIFTDGVDTVENSNSAIQLSKYMGSENVKTIFFLTSNDSPQVFEWVQDSFSDATIFDPSYFYPSLVAPKITEFLLK
jgi:Mg-chelatase subunit ChlD